MTSILTEYQNSKKRKLECVPATLASSISPTLINESCTAEENKKKKISSIVAPLNQNIMLVVYENLFKKIVQPYCNFQIPILENSSSFMSALAQDNVNHNFCHWNAILAIGAEFAGNLINAEQYIEKARIYAQPVDNLNYNYTTALDYVLLLIYYFLFEKGCKAQANKYISSLLEVCSVIRTKKCPESEQNIPEIELLAYNIQFFISHDNKINVCKILRNMESNIRAKVLSAYFVAEEALKLTPNFEIYNAALQKISDMDMKLEQNRSQFTALEYINCISTSKAIQSILYYSIGFKELALSCANNAYIAFVQELEMQEYNLMWWQVRLVEYFASVHLNLFCKNNVLLDISLLEKCAKLVSCPDLVVELLPNLREQLSQITPENVSFLDYQENSLFNNVCNDTSFLLPSDLALTTLLDDESNQFLSDDSSTFSDLWRQDIGGLYTDFDEPNSRPNVEQYSFPCDFITG